MTSRAQATRYVDCPFSATIEFAQQALLKESDVTISPVSPESPVSERVAVSTEMVEDIEDTARKHEALNVHWKPQRRYLFPDFHGVLTVRPQARGSSLRIDGTYQPPFGSLGRVFDALAGRIVARRTLERLLDDLAQKIEARWEAFRAEAPGPETPSAAENSKQES